jgi:uncharacterized protein
MKMIRICQVLWTALVLAASIIAAHASEVTPPLRINYLAYPVDYDGKTVIIGARLQVPVGAPAKLPAVILLHGTSGLSYRGVYYAAALNRVGIATLEIDQWGGRGLAGVAASRPKGLGDMLPDIVGAYKLLVSQPEIDASRIGIMGSSMGGRETMLMMTHQNSDALLGAQVHFKAALAFYPICWRYNKVPGADFKDLVDAPIRIIVGNDDDYDGGQAACESLLQELPAKDAAHLSLRAFAGATHEFDAFDGAREFYDPAADRRKGGTVRVRPDPAAREQARADLVAFFVTALKPGGAASHP